MDMINEHDIDGNAEIDFDEFLHFMARKNKDIDSYEELLDGFKVFDTNHDNLITIDDLRKLMAELEENEPKDNKITEEEMQHMIKVACPNEDGKVSFEMFKQVLSAK